MLAFFTEAILDMAWKNIRTWAVQAIDYNKSTTKSNKAEVVRDPFPSVSQQVNDLD